jgi:hypothetical protein
MGRRQGGEKRRPKSAKESKAHGYDTKKKRGPRNESLFKVVARRNSTR